MKRPEMARVFAKLTEHFLSVVCALLRSDAKAACGAYLLDRVNPIRVVETKHGSILFYCSSSETYSISVMKEKRTRQWIDGFEDGDVLYDVGAHAGAYTLYAARRNIRVYAFEPAASTYATLVKNVQINQFNDRVHTINVALNDKTLLNVLHMEDTLPGRCGHNFGDIADGLMESYKPVFAYRQTSLGYSLDDIIEHFKLEIPNHIKIDVDGNEDRIIDGALKTISRSEVKTIGVELYQDWRQGSYNNRVTEVLNDRGFQLVDEVEYGSGVPGNHLFTRN